MNRFSTALGLVFFCACAGTTPPAKTSDDAAPAPDANGGGAASLPEAMGALNCANATLDDLEDGDGRAAPTDGRGGYWYTYKDEAGSSVDPQGSFTPSEGGANGSKMTARMQGKTADAGIVYVGMGVNLTDPLGAYDLSAASGLCFQAKGKGPVRVKLPDVYTTPEGGQCSQCYNDFGADFVLTQEWKEYCFEFSQLKQQAGWGEQKPSFTKSRVFSVQWQVGTPGQEFEVAVDDVRFTCGGAAANEP